MKMSKLLTIIAAVMVFVLTFTACGIFQQVDPNAQTTPPANTETTPPANTETTPVISVVPETLEIHAGDDIELMFGVTVTDEGDEAPTLIIEDDDGFDAEVEGTYTITYKAVNKYGKTATATRKVTVLKALSALTLEVRANRLGETKWQGNLLSFKNKEFVTLTGDYVSDVAISGVFYNNSESAIVINIAGGYGVAAIIDANGFVLEGRDGANSKLVNEANPDRTASSVTSIEIDGETVTVASAFAKNLTVPAGGYAIVVQNGYCGTTVDSDGRGFMNYNVIYQYGNVVRLLWADNAEVLTPYVDQAPVITGHNNKVLANLTDGEFDLATAILGGLTIVDDNGTFDPSDDIKFDLENETIVKVTVDNNGGFDINTVGSYTITLTATDGTHTTTVTRVVDVVDNLVKILVGENAYALLPDKIAVDQDLTVLGSYLFVLYTPAYEGALNWTNGWGEAFVLNQYGQIVRIYDGANGKYYDAENKGGVVDATKCTAGEYLKQAFASLQDGEYLIVAPNGTSGNLTRAFFLSNRTIGAQMTIPGIEFPEAPHACESVCDTCGKCLDAECAEEACAEKCEGHTHTCESKCEVCAKCADAECTEEICTAKCDCVVVVVNGKTFKAAAGTIAIDVAAPAIGSHNFIIYSYSFKEANAELSWSNGWAQVFVVNEYGQVVRIYDGVSGGKYFDISNRAGIVDSNITTAGTVLKDAYASLQAGEYLILGANGSMNGNAARTFLGSNRVIGALVTVPGITFTALPEHECESKCADCGKCTDTTCIAPACLAQCACHKCESKCAVCGGCLDANCTEKACETKCTCHFCSDRCEICGGCKVADCTESVCEIKCVCSYEGADKYFAIDGKFFLAADGKWLYNTQVNNTTDPKAQNYRLIIFDKNYTGTFTTNSYGVALVVDANGYLVKGYAWDGYYTAEGKAAIHYAVGDYATTAFNELKDGEVLIIFANDGVNAADSARTFGKGVCDAKYMGKKVHITGLTFGVIHECESACAACNGCTDAECAEEVCATKCECKVLTIGDLSFTAKTWLYNTQVNNTTDPKAQNYKLIIFDKNYEGTFTTNSYGVALVVDQYGNLVKGYAWDGYYTAEGKAAIHYAVGDYATTAFNELKDGEMLLIFANDGVNAADSARTFGKTLCDVKYMGEKISLTGFTFAEHTKTITIGSKTYTAAEDKWLYNTAVTSETAASYAILIYDKSFEGTFATNGYGVAVVLDAQGKVIRVYDGANLGYWLPAGKQASAHFDVNSYATTAWAELQEGELLIVLPHGGSEGNAARQVGLDCRYLFNQKMSVTDITFAE